MGPVKQLRGGWPRWVCRQRAKASLFTHQREAYLASLSWTCDQAECESVVDAANHQNFAFHLIYQRDRGTLGI
jgi:hypothetical protein